MSKNQESHSKKNNNVKNHPEKKFNVKNHPGFGVLGYWVGLGYIWGGLGGIN